MNDSPDVAATSTTLRSKFLLLAGSLVLTVLVIETVLRGLGIGYGAVHMASSALLHHEHPRDYRFVSYHPSGEFGGHEVYFDTAGRRASPVAVTSSAPPSSLRPVVVMGDSFVEALQVAYRDSFVGRLQSRAGGRSVHNYGTSSYSPLLYLLQWQHRIRPLKPTHVFLVLFGNDVRDDRSMTDVGIVGGDGRIEAVPGPETTPFTRLTRLSYFGRLLRKVQLQLAWRWRHGGDTRRGDGHSPDAFGFVEEHPPVSTLTDGYLRQLVRDIRATGAEIVLMAVPSRLRSLGMKSSPGTRTFHDRIKEWAAREGVPFIDLAGPFKNAAAVEPLFYTRDIHFTEAGHRVVARAILEAYPQVFGSGT